MEVMELLKRARAGDREARNRMVEENVGLVWNIVKRFTGRGYDKEDIFQIGCIGLIKAIDHFDMNYQVRFSTYAVPMIAGEIKRFLRDDGMIKVSRTLKENGWKVKRVAENLSQELGRNATIDEIAAATELSTEEIVLAMEANSEVDSIYRPVYQSEGKDVMMADQVIRLSGSSIGYAGTNQMEYGNMINQNGALLDTEKEKVLDRMLLKQLLDELGETEKTLISCRYFQDMTQTQVAKQLGISQVQVSRLEKRILRQMREKALGQKEEQQ
ncbi:MAG: SigB/SigF/SigG family RNA polymerase sigma factor [Butyribacter sp.]|nr:SigB/SigF/SigG family RNA polymerase sigma factor [bacterium]MDY3853805.1 SigB/SigF/SigG family RNA polymerase sigma factor [Butyribacter sp.]